MTPPLSVVIPTHNRQALLVRCLRSLSQQSYPADRAEIVVVDDGSDAPANETELAAAAAPCRVRLVSIPHGGAGAARARGVAEVRGTIVAFLDDDCTVPPEYLAAVEAAFADVSVQIVQVGLKNPEPDNLYGRAWERVWKMAVAASSSEPAPDGRVHLRLLGGVMAARRVLFERIAFEPTLRAREDIDLRFQIEALGIPIIYDPRITVFNHCRRTLGDYLRQQAWYGRNEAALRRKWGASPGVRLNPTSYQALRDALREEGWKDGLAIHLILRLKRHAGIAGFLQQQARDRAGTGGWRYGVEWARGVLVWYARHLAGALRRAVRRLLAGGRATP